MKPNITPFSCAFIRSVDQSGAFCPLKDRKTYPLGTPIKHICIDSGIVQSGKEYKRLYDVIKMDGLTIQDRFDDEKIVSPDTYKEDLTINRPCRFYLMIGSKETPVRLITVE